MSADESDAVRAGHSYFRLTEHRAEKGSGLAMIAQQNEATKTKTARLRAAREEKESADAVLAAEALANAPVKKPSKPRKKAVTS